MEDFNFVGTASLQGVVVPPVSCHIVASQTMNGSVIFRNEKQSSVVLSVRLAQKRLTLTPSPPSMPSTVPSNIIQQYGSICEALLYTYSKPKQYVPHKVLPCSRMNAKGTEKRPLFV